MIFRASKYNFSAQAFHDQCDNIHDTFILARTEFGKTIGGYSHYMWNDPTVGEDGEVKDLNRRAFLLQLDLRQKLIPIADDGLIKCSKSCGPCFGGLTIADKCDVK